MRPSSFSLSTRFLDIARFMRPSRLMRNVRFVHMAQRTSSALLALCALLAIALLPACSTVNGLMFPPGVKLDWESVSVYVDPAANRDFPVAVDVVLVSDEALARRVSLMRSQDWFGARDALRKTHPEDIEFDSVELAPGESITLPGKRYSGKRVFAAYAFADYFSAGDHRVRLDTLKGRISMELGATDFSASASRK